MQFPGYYSLIRHADISADEEPKGWIPLAVKISHDDNEIRITQIDEVFWGQ